jgi:DnaJ-class molecular chaperone
MGRMSRQISAYENHRGFVKISNESELGKYFHRKLQTLCDGCHHQSRAEAEMEKDSPPYCRNCHGITFDRQNRNRPKLIAAYHGQCMGCHDSMKLEKARKCEECHKKKTAWPAYPLEPQRIVVR